MGARDTADRPNPVELTVDVTEAADLGTPAHTAVTVVRPDPSSMADPPVVCFAFPGGGYSRRYYTFDMPGDGGGGQAGWHAARGWIFVACDHLGVGDSTIPNGGGPEGGRPTGDGITFETAARVNHATVGQVMAHLADGTLPGGYPPVRGATVLGIGQSMGGCFTIVQQAHHATFDGIAALGFSGIHTVVPGRPGGPPVSWPWYRRGADLASVAPLNADALATTTGGGAGPGEPSEHPMQWAFHYDDEPADVVAADMAADLDGRLPPWRSATVPACAIYMVAPGAVATEAAAITAPVLLAMGERDVVPNPWMEPFAFRSSRDVTLFVCPQMAHMHNFAGTRRRFWARIHSWGQGVAAGAGR